jgi:hypothetical protein
MSYDARHFARLLAAISFAIAAAFASSPLGNCFGDESSSPVQPVTSRGELARRYADLLGSLADFSENAVRRSPAPPRNQIKDVQAGKGRPTKEDGAGEQREPKGKAKKSKDKLRERQLEAYGFKDEQFWKRCLQFQDEFEELGRMFSRPRGGLAAGAKVVKLRTGWLVPFDRYDEVHQRLTEALRTVEGVLKPMDEALARERLDYERQQRNNLIDLRRAATDLREAADTARKVRSGQLEGREHGPFLPSQGKKLTKAQSMAYLGAKAADAQARMMTGMVGISPESGPRMTEEHAELSALRVLLQGEVERLSSAARVKQELPSPVGRDATGK